MSTPTHDVTLNGDNYMVLPGTYRSYPDGNLYVDSRLQRQILTDFTAGMAGPKPNARNLPASAVYGEQSVSYLQLAEWSRGRARGRGAFGFWVCMAQLHRCRFIKITL